MRMFGGIHKKLKRSPKIARAGLVGLIILALLLQANYGAFAQMATSLFKPSANQYVPPLEQEQELTEQPAADLNAPVTSPILAAEQEFGDDGRPKADYEDKSKRTERSETIVGADGMTTKRISLAEPMHHKKNGVWEELKPTAAKGKDATTLSVGDIKMSAKPLKQGIEYEYKGKKFSVTLEGANNVAPKLAKEDDKDVLIYENAMDGIDLKYTISGYSIKEDIVVKSKTAPTTYKFTYKGVTLSEHKDVKGGVALGGLLDNELFIAPLNVSTSKQLVTEPVIGQTVAGSVVSVALDATWLAGLPADQLPVTVDPTIKTITKTQQGMKTIRSDGYSCGPDICSAHAGVEEYSDYWANWRTILQLPFNEMVDDPDSLGGVASAKLHLVRNGGVASNESYLISPAGCWDYNCAIVEQYSNSYGQLTDDSWIDVYNVVTWMYSNGMTDQPMMIRGVSEGIMHRTFKSFDLSQLVLEVKYVSDVLPPEPEVIYPADKKVISNLQPILSVKPVTDPDGDPVQYVFMLMTSPRNVIALKIQDETHWVVPEGVLKDGVTYYWGADARIGQSPHVRTTHSFTVDMRRGKDSTQSYDTVGPVSIDQATGNVSTSVSSHKMKALGGDLGVSLDYNSPAMSRPGLVAEYWNDEALTGSPKLTTLAPTVQFDWKDKSPLSYTDNPSANGFSARYSGIVSVPQSGNYTFGTEHDDGARVYINNNLVSDAWNAGGTAYGSSVYLTAGVNATIKVEYREHLGDAKIKLMVKTPTNPAGEVVDRTWLTTGVKSLSESNGLTADYYRASDGNGTFPSSLIVSGEEASFSFRSDNGLGDKVPGGIYAPDLVRYRGLIKVPTTGSYKFIVEHSGGLRMRLNNQEVINNWDRNATNSETAPAMLTAGSLVPVEIEYWVPEAPYGQEPKKAILNWNVEGPGIAQQIVPAQWLSKRQALLPAGWQMGVDGNGSGYDALRVNGTSVTLTDSTGSTHEYKWENNAFTPPANEHGILTRAPDGTHTFKDDDGKEYVFAADGNLTSMSAPTDDKRPAGLKYVYSGTPSRLTKIVDSLNVNRYAELLYAGVNAGSNCTAPTGFDAVPSGYLCKVKTTDGAETALHYKSGNLARVEGAGSQITDFAYDTLKRMVSLRDPLANDAIAAGIRSTTDSSIYDIGYDIAGKAKSVTFPAATVGATRAVHNYSYIPGATLFKKTGATEPAGYSQRIEYDDSFRTLKTFGHDGKFTQVQWHPAKDLVLSTTDPLGLKTTTIYDENDRPAQKYGPAPEAWFGTDNKPLPAQEANIAKTESKYDEGMQGLSASSYDNKFLAREPKARSFESGNLMRQWTSANRPVTPTADGWGMRLSGQVVLPVTGDYIFKLYSDDGVKAYIDDRLYINDWTDGAERFHEQATYSNDQVGKRVNLRIEYYDKDQNDPASKLELRIYKPGATEAEAVQTQSFLVPNFSLTTSETVTDSTMGQVTNTRTYNRPEYGVLDKVTLDPAGLNYASTTTTEAPGTAFFRQTGKTLPGGNATSYQHYTSFDTKDNPCTTAVEATPQAGLPKGKTETDPDGSGPLTGQKSEMIYDASGQVVAARINNEAWTCTTYDNRGRVTKVETPANGSRPGMTSETDYAVGGNPLKIATSDFNGAVTTESDLLGRTVKYTDAYGNVTTPTYDDQGRVTTKVNTMLGTESFTYDNLDRLTKYTLNSATVANIFYDEFSRVKNIDYPIANLKLVSFEYDTLLRIKAANWKLSDGSDIREEQTKSTTGLVTSNKRTVGTDVLDQSYTYDKAGRLRTANIGTHTMSYGFDPLPSTCGATRNTNAHKNANRSSQTIDGVTTTYCYDMADRLISSSDTQYNTPVYDDRGNITQIGTNGKPLKFAYDQANRAIRMEQQDASGNGTITEFKRDAGGRILERKQTKLTNGTPSVQSQVKYGYSTPGDSPDIILNMSGGLMQRMYSLPGGISLNIDSTQSQQAKQRTYSIPNFHGDTMVTANFSGLKNDVFTYDPFGNQLDATVQPQNNSAPGTVKGYLGQFNRLTEADFSVPVTNMGDRVYLPGLGRFAQTDPVEGGNANAYIYPADPVNSMDVDGNFIWFAPVAWFVVRQVVLAVVVHYAAKAIAKVVPPPYRAPAEAAVNIASFASPGRAAGGTAVKAPAVVTRVEKTVKNAFGSGTFKSTAVHGNSRASTKPTRIYELWTDDGQYLKTGVTSNPIPENRYPKSFMVGKRMEFPIGGRDSTMDRSPAYDLERFLVMKNPGPLNKERWLKR